MDELRGVEGTWRLDGESVRIQFHRRRWRDPLLRRLGQCRVPLPAVSAVEFQPDGAGKHWSLRLVLPAETDPYTAVGLTLTKHAHPLRLTGPARSVLLAEFWADQLTVAAQAARQAPDPPGPELARQLVPPLPVHIRSSEGAAVFDGRSIRFSWTPSAPRRKRKAKFREFPLAEVLRVELMPTDGWEWDLLRVVTEASLRDPVPDPKRDLSCLRCYPGKEGAAGLLLAATITAYLPAGGQLPGQAALPPAGPAGPDRTEHGPDRAEQLSAMLAALHREGLLTDAELAAKQAHLRDQA